MDDRRLDRLEQELVRHARRRYAGAAVPPDFTAQVMRSVRLRAERGRSFWDIFSLAAWRFAPVGALAAAAACGYAQLTERLLNQSLLALSLHGGGSALTLAGLLP